MESKQQVMVDLETLGNKPGCVIVSLGAVVFDRAAGVGRSFYERVDADSCLRAGLRMDPATVRWWMMQPEAARAELVRKGADLFDVLERFSAWVREDPRVADVWGNGASFDNAVLAAAYDAVDLPRPWEYWNDRCYRTVKALYPGVPMARRGQHHNALDDATSQAEHLLAIWAAEKGAGVPAAVEAVADTGRRRERWILLDPDTDTRRPGDECWNAEAGQWSEVGSHGGDLRPGLLYRRVDTVLEERADG